LTETERAQDAGHGPRPITFGAVAALLAILVLVALAAMLAGVRADFDPWGPVSPGQTDGGPIVNFALALISSLGAGIGLVALTSAAVLGLVRLGRRSEAVFVAVAVYGSVIVSRPLKYYFHASRPPAPDWVSGTSGNADLLVAAIAGLVGVAVVVAIVIRLSPPPRWRVWLAAGVVVAGAALATEWLIGRALPLTPGSDSYPSGHAIYSMTLASALVVATWRRMPARIAILAALSVYVLAVGMSRVYVHAHYPADVAAGWCVALAWTAGLGLVWRPGRQASASAAGR
jgi:hypothetical protein